VWDGLTAALMHRIMKRYSVSKRQHSMLTTLNTLLKAKRDRLFEWGSG
jgi:hypothetical protein